MSQSKIAVPALKSEAELESASVGWVMVMQLDSCLRDGLWIPIAFSLISQQEVGSYHTMVMHELDQMDGVVGA